MLEIIDVLEHLFNLPGRRSAKCNAELFKMVLPYLIRNPELMHRFSTRLEQLRTSDSLQSETSRTCPAFKRRSATKSASCPPPH